MPAAKRQNKGTYIRLFMKYSEVDLTKSMPSWLKINLQHGKYQSRSRPAHATVLGLPGKEIQQRAERLSNKAEAHPEDAISNGLAEGVAHLLQGRGKGDQW